MKRVVSVVLLAFLSSLVIAACAPKPEATPTQPAPVSKQIVIAPGPVGVGAYTISVTITSMLKKYTDLEGFVLGSAKGSIAALIAAGKADVGSQSTVTIAHAFEGKEDPLYIGKPPLSSIRMLNAGTMLPFALFVQGNSGIKSVADLKGKRVPTEIVDTWSTGYYTRSILRAAGLDPAKDITPTRVASIAEGWEQLMAGKVDAFMTTVRGPRMVELETKVKGYAITMGEAPAQKIAGLVPGSVPLQVKKGVPAVREADIWVMGIQEAFFATTAMSDDMAYLWVKTMTEHNMEFVAEQAEMKDWGKQNALILNMPAPYHAGAIKYYKEIGIWTDAMEKAQQAVLAKIKATK